jgi:hypothetical protein
VNRFAIFALGALAVVASCGVADDRELQEINSADLFGLDETTTSTSTTSTTLVPATSPVQPTIRSTSTTIATEPVSLYFVDGRSLTEVSIDLARGPSPSRVVAALLAGPPAGEVGIGLRSLLPENLVNTVVESGTGYVTVDLVGEELQRIDPADQRGAIGQLVLTLTQRPGVGQVRFTTDGQLQRVPRGDGLQSEAGEPVSRQDYVSLLDIVEASTTVVTEAPVETTLAPLASGPT